ncbi:beta-ketoacyl synthase N-terminal-like domain-containing protein [Flavobacterium sp.]|uniref:beta-ketoacyl synthase N-terminal-like domain-containing protein n=1 Tax=Flavobacterium sp. TaxID=239 RepID=UPI0028BF439F|nr:beta-ketoacyl synthase N-terminal-like domain-containing protein [Flavobacterium sp.]
MKPIAITALASFSPLGNQPDAIWAEYLKPTTQIINRIIGGKTVPVAAISDVLRAEVLVLRQSDHKYKFLDNSVLYAMLASRAAIRQAGWNQNDVFGINIGSSRGATELFENYHEEFITTGKTATLASPTTTMGNISSWVAHDLKASGPEISHSITCSTALHALLNGVAWLRSGMVDKFLVGGSEASLTPFTIAQMQALKIYSKEEGEYPCRAFDLNKEKNTMVLGEGAGVLCMQTESSEKALAYIEGVGYATDILEHGISISTEAECFQKSMTMAMGKFSTEDIDGIVMHAPGTIKGDLSEYKAIQKLFGDKLPLLTTNKWKLGHTFGASGILSVELAVMMLQHQQFVGVPFVETSNNDVPLRKILVNAVGFGGNAVTVLVSV